MNATTSGESGGQSEPSDSAIVGNDSDEHGCKGSAGYSWCELKGKCVRNWEEPCLKSETTSTSGAKTTTTRTYENGVKEISVENAGRWELNKTVTIVNDSYKSMEIVTPQKTITVEVAGRGMADEVRNSVALSRLSDEFGKYTEVESVEMDPETNRVRARVRTENGTEKDTELPETVRTTIQVTLQERQANVTISGETRTINITTATMTVSTSNKVEVENETIYIVTAKERKRMLVLPDNASEMAKLKANFQVVKTMEIVENDGSVVYAIKGRQTGKVLGLFPAELDVDSDVDVETGTVSNIKKPWWAFLVF